MQIYEVLIRPLITEKSSLLKESDCYVFEINKAATKPQVKQAVETAFKVKVVKVNVITVPGKLKRFGRRYKQTPPMKKAVVTLQPGNKIEFFEGV